MNPVVAAIQRAESFFRSHWFSRQSRHALSFKDRKDDFSFHKNMLSVSVLNQIN